MRRLRDAVVAFLVAVDLAASAAFGGEPWQSISARLGAALPACVFCRICCRVLAALLGPDHCDRAHRDYSEIKAIMERDE